MCYTNHALDQFLEDLLNIGIPEESIVRIGGKANEKTESLALHKQVINSGFKLKRADWSIINIMKNDAECRMDALIQQFQQFHSFRPNLSSVLDHLNLEYPEYYAAFFVPESDDGMTRIGKRGRVINSEYLIERWTRGENAGIFINSPDVMEASEIWNVAPKARRKLYARWVEELLKQASQGVYEKGKEYNDCLKQIDRQFSQGDAVLLRQKRIIGCTTTGAAKYREEIASAHTDVLLVEEAGEILESHVLTALGEETKQVILIGDHK